uniref:TACC_C domain-containing protein n=1 Tax=Caenorhabditis tropicalis TaxID=1561998 RepID=A0A1I7SYB6_9PELO
MEQKKKLESLEKSVLLANTYSLRTVQEKYAEELAMERGKREKMEKVCIEMKENLCDYNNYYETFHKKHNALKEENAELKTKYALLEDKHRQLKEDIVARMLDDLEKVLASQCL